MPQFKRDILLDVENIWSTEQEKVVLFYLRFAIRDLIDYRNRVQKNIVIAGVCDGL